MGTAYRLSFLVALLALLASGHIGAQGIKKYITPDGKTIYSDTPIPGAREAGEVAPPPPVDPDDRREAERAARREAQRADEGVQRAEESISSEQEIRSAEKRVEEAQQALEAGKEPLPGERQGTAGGASRLTEAYFERQRANERAVEEAQRQLDAARAGR